MLTVLPVRSDLLNQNYLKVKVSARRAETMNYFIAGGLNFSSLYHPQIFRHVFLSWLATIYVNYIYVIYFYPASVLF